VLDNCEATVDQLLSRRFFLNLNRSAGPGTFVFGAQSDDIKKGYM
jgi:hypothetical protein